MQTERNCNVFVQNTSTPNLPLMAFKRRKCLFMTRLFTTYLPTSLRCNSPMSFAFWSVTMAGITKSVQSLAVTSPEMGLFWRWVSFTARFTGEANDVTLPVDHSVEPFAIGFMCINLPKPNSSENQFGNSWLSPSNSQLPLLCQAYIWPHFSICKNNSPHLCQCKKRKETPCRWSPLTDLSFCKKVDLQCKCSEWSLLYDITQNAAVVNK